MIAILTAASQRVGKCTNAANTTIEANRSAQHPNHQENDARVVKGDVEVKNETKHRQLQHYEPQTASPGEPRQLRRRPVPPHPQEGSHPGCKREHGSTEMRNQRVRKMAAVVCARSVGEKDMAAEWIKSPWSRAIRIMTAPRTASTVRILLPIQPSLTAVAHALLRAAPLGNDRRHDSQTGPATWLTVFRGQRSAAFSGTSIVCECSSPSREASP